jgi:hypothetical protein
MDIDFRNDWSAYLTDTKDLLVPQLIDDDNEVKLLLKNIMHLWHWIFSISIISFDYHYHKEVYKWCTIVHRSARPYDHAPYVFVNLWIYVEILNMSR